jgi:hypothetical protein
VDLDCDWLMVASGRDRDSDCDCESIIRLSECDRLALFDCVLRLAEFVVDSDIDGVLDLVEVMLLLALCEKETV